METMERYRVRESIGDVIAILDSAPIRWDLMADTNIVQIANRVPIAHLAMERGLKALISEGGGAHEWTHSLNRLYQNLQECDEDSANHLKEAFHDAVCFFGYNVNRKGFRQFRSLYEYLSKVGTESAFDEFRYWAIGEPSRGQSPIAYISLSIHRELLCALDRLFLPNGFETVSARVEREVSEALFSRRHIAYGASDTKREQSVHWYMDWLAAHPSRRSALEEAVQKNLVIYDDEYITQILIEAYKELQQAKDPAILYFLNTLTYLPEGSERRNRDATPEVKWISQGQHNGIVATRGGTSLGHIERCADGAWGITPMQSGLLHIAAVAWAQADAKHYLVNRLTSQVAVTVNGESRRLRIIDDRGFFSKPAWIPENEDSHTLTRRSAVYELEFWDGQHGLRPGDDVVVELGSRHSDGVVSVLTGAVTEVAEQKVSVTGADYLDVRRNC